MSDEELQDHWDGCPLPPDANCETCHEFARRFLRGGPLEALYSDGWAEQFEADRAAFDPGPMDAHIDGYDAGLVPD